MSANLLEKTLEQYLKVLADYSTRAQQADYAMDRQSVKSEIDIC